ncbi:MAG TPA: ImmA/IrrE family metallo-endopeptidase [Cyclobacteriaceae bacterium]|jgi:Zn-dependent peptidase ImmA (M78 family)
MPKPRRLTQRYICDEADKTRGSEDIPVEIEEIIELKYKIQIVPLRELLKVVNTEGFLSKDKLEIYVDQERYINPIFKQRLRFTLAHELGHYILHPEFYEDVEFKKPEDIITFFNSMNEDDLHWFEYQANEFAGRILVPVTKLESLINGNKSYIEELKGKFQESDGHDDLILDAFSRKICGDFDVSNDVIKIRIHKERLIEHFS